MKYLLLLLLSVPAFAGWNPMPIQLTASETSVAKGSGQTFTLTATYIANPGEEETILFTVPSDTDTKALSNGGSTTSKTFDLTSEVAGWKTCQASFQNAVMITKIAVVEVDKIQFMNDRITDNNWTDWPSVIYPQLDQTVEFKAFPFPSDAPWPSNYPIWGGSATGNGSDEVSVAFSTIENTTVKAYCDASYGATENVTVVQNNGDASFELTPAGEFKAIYNFTCWMLDGGAGELAISMPVSDYDATLEVKKTDSFSSGAFVNESYIYRTGIDTSSNSSEIELAQNETGDGGIILVDNRNAFPSLEHKLKGGLFDCQTEGSLGLANPAAAVVILTAVIISVGEKIIDMAVEDQSNNVDITFSPITGNGIINGVACSFSATTTAGCDDSWAISTWLNNPWNEIECDATPAFVTGFDGIDRYPSPRLGTWCNYRPLSGKLGAFNQAKLKLRLVSNKSPSEVNNFPGASTAGVVYRVDRFDMTNNSTWASIGSNGVTKYHAGSSNYMINAQRGADHSRISWP